MPSPTVAPSATSAPAATIAPAPTRERERTIAPMPIVAPSSTVVPWTMAPWPIVTSAPTTQGAPGSTWSTAPSCTFDRAPMRTGATSPRIVTLNHTVEPGPISTSPITAAPGARKTSSAMRGETPLNGSTTGSADDKLAAPTFTGAIGCRSCPVANWISCRSALDVQDHGVALTAAGADRGQTESAAAAAQLVHQRDHQPRAARPKRVAESDGAAVDVHLLRIGAEAARGNDRDAGERLVDLEEVDIADLESRLLQRHLRRHRRRVGEVCRLPGGGRVCQDRRGGGEPALLCPVVAGDDDRCGAVVHAGRVAGGDGAVRVEGRLQLRQRLGARVAARGLVPLDDGRPLAVADPDRHDLFGQRAAVLRRHRPLVRAQRPGILLLAPDPLRRRHGAALLPHVAAVERPGQAVRDHHVFERAV